MAIVEAPFHESRTQQQAAEAYSIDSATLTIEAQRQSEFLPSRTGLGEVRFNPSVPESAAQAFARLEAKRLLNGHDRSKRITSVSGSVTEAPKPGDEKYVYYNPAICEDDIPDQFGNVNVLLRRDQKSGHSEVVRATFNVDTKDMTLVKNSRVLDNCEDPYLYRDSHGVLHAGMVKVLNDLTPESGIPAKTRIKTVVYRLENGLADLDNPQIQPVIEINQTKDFKPIALDDGTTLNLLRPQAGQIWESEEMERSALLNRMDSAINQLLSERDEIDSKIFGRGKIGGVISDSGKYMSQQVFDQFIAVCRKMALINKDRLDQLGGFIFDGQDEQQQAAFERLMGEKPLFRRAFLRFDQTVGDDHVGANGGKEGYFWVNGQIKKLVRIDMHIGSRMRDARGNIMQHGPDDIRRYGVGEFYLDPQTCLSTQVQITDFRESFPRITDPEGNIILEKEMRNASLFSVAFPGGRYKDSQGRKWRLYGLGDAVLATGMIPQTDSIKEVDNSQLINQEDKKAA